MGGDVEVEERKGEEWGEETDKRAGMVEEDGVEKEEGRGGGCEEGVKRGREDKMG